MQLLIQGGRLAGKPEGQLTDVLMEDGIITQIGEGIAQSIKQHTIEGEASEVQIIDATGCILFPGFIDAHTHFDMDTGTAHTADDFYTGTKAALRGGTTTIIDFATQEKGQTLQEALDIWHQKAQGKSCSDYGFHMAITDWTEEVAEELEVMKAQGVTSFKLYMAYDSLRVSDRAVYQVLKKVKALGGIVGVHCENGDLVNELIQQNLKEGHTSPVAHPKSRPDIVEKEAISRYLDIAYLADAPVHIVHLSTKIGLETIRAARQRGQKVYVETCPQYLLLDEGYYQLDGFESAKYVLAPPLRSKEDVEALWQGVKAGEIDTISTDHCSFNYVGQKELGKEDFSKIPCGIPGVEHRPQLIYTYGVKTGYIGEEQMAHLLSTHAAQLFGMYPRKGTLQVGSDADIVVWNPAYEDAITASDQLQNVDYTPYEGFRIVGRPEHVLLGGEVVVSQGKVVEERKGKYVKRLEANAESF
ncbi:MAG: dihydropyrimidinase [Cellulosilyticaceae bacterium]